MRALHSVLIARKGAFKCGLQEKFKHYEARIRKRVLYYQFIQAYRVTVTDTI